MMYRTHLAFAFLFGLLFLNFVNPGSVILYFVLVLFGGLLPDIDEHHSKLGRKIRPISNILNFVFGHRTLFHSLFFGVILFGIVGYFFGLTAGLGLFIGYMSHLIIDGFTPSGINYLYPFSKLHLKGFVRTGSIGEHFVYLLIIVVSVFSFVFLF